MILINHAKYLLGWMCHGRFSLFCVLVWFFYDKMKWNIWKYKTQWLESLQNNSERQPNMLIIRINYNLFSSVSTVAHTHTHTNIKHTQIHEHTHTTTTTQNTLIKLRIWNWIATTKNTQRSEAFNRNERHTR